MQDRESRAPGLRIELFVRDLDVSSRFYRQALGFSVLRETPGAYQALAREGAVIGLNLAANLADGHPVKPTSGARPGQGVEIVLMAADIDAAFAMAAASGFAIAAPLTDQPWGLRDFRMIDPDGYYLRLTSLSA